MINYNNKFRKGRFNKGRQNSRPKFYGRYRHYNNRFQRDPILQDEGYELTPVCGYYRRNEKGAVLRKMERSFKPEENEIFIRQELCRRYGLIQGAYIEGSMAEINGKKWVIEIDSINGLIPEVFRFRPQLTELPAVAPVERFDLASTGDESMRIVDLVAPIGKGTRALIVSPPKAGKTTILEKLANSIKEVSPESHVIVLLVDERPEEVTHFRRALPDVDVLASNNDQSPWEHVELVRTVMDMVKIELECSKDVVVLMDSITRIGRAFNLNNVYSNKLMSGGLAPGSMEIPRRFFGMARKIENGGSLTIIATALIDTGSRMDELIFQEFKGTGNCEIVLDRSLADARIFPAININQSGTRREELLYPEKEYAKLVILRRALADESTKNAIVSLKESVERSETNKALLQALRD